MIASKITSLTSQEMAEDILMYITSHDWVTYAELQRRYGDQAQGALAHTLENENLILWTGMSSLFADAMNLLQKNKAIHPHISGYLTYLVDGIIPNLPIAKRNISYKRPHWVPVVFRLGSSCTHEDCPF